MFRKLILLIATLVALLPTTIFAEEPIPAPDTGYGVGMLAGTSHAYIFPDVIIEGDALYLSVFDLKYATVPTNSAGNDIPATAHWEVILFNDATYPAVDTILDTAPLYADISPTAGYNKGVFGIYEGEAFTLGAGEVLKFCLNPLSTTGTRLCTSSITPIVPSSVTPIDEVLHAKLIIIFEALETDWRVKDDTIDLIETLSDITKVLTLTGEDYATNMIESIRTILPAIFSTSSITPNYVEETYDTTATDGMSTFFEGTELDPSDPNSSLGAIATYTKIPVSIIGLVIVLSVASAIAAAVISSTGRSEVGMLAGIMCITAGTYVGLIPFALAGIFAMLGALALGYIFFYKSSTS